MSWKTWGDAFNANLRKGYDHGYAAWKADEWENRAFPMCPCCKGDGRIPRERFAEISVVCKELA